MIEEKLAFEVEDRGFKIRAFWGDGPDARIEITRNGEPYRTFNYPAYKIFNLAAHFSDIVDSEIAKNIDGYLIAGSDGLGGVVTPTPEQGAGEYFSARLKALGGFTPEISKALG